MSDPKKFGVLLVVPWDQESGGVASVVGYLARHLESRGHRVLFVHPGVPEVSRYKKTKWGFDGVELNLRTPEILGRRLRSGFAFLVTLPLTLIQLLRLIRKHDIRVVNVHYPLDSFVYFALCRLLLPIRLVVSVHGADVLPVDAPGQSRAIRALLRAADLIVGPSRAFLRECSHALADSSARQIVVHNGMDPAELQLQGSVSRADGPDAYVLSVASHDHWKGLDVLIRAIALMRERGETIRLVLAGDGPERPKLEQLAKSLDLQQQVQFAGYQSRLSVARLLNECTLFVLPSRSEPFGIAVIEALACSAPVVATSVGGIPEIIENGTHGILVDPDDAPALATAMHRLLEDPGLRARLGHAGRQRVAESFVWPRMGENYEHAFEDVLVVAHEARPLAEGRTNLGLR